MDEVLEAAAHKIVQVFPRICMCGDSSLTVSKRGDLVCVFGNVEELTINARWSTIEGDIKIPVSIGGSYEETIRRWKSPENMHLVLAVFMRYNRGAPPQFESCALIARCAEEAGWFRPPISNIYEDGRVCLGDSNIPRVTRVDTVQTVWSKTLQVLNDAPYGSDMAGAQTPEQIAAIFGFKNEQQNTVEKWWTECQKVNNEYYDLIKC